MLLLRMLVQTNLFDSAVQNKIQHKKLYLCAVNLFRFDERSHCSFETFCSSCALVGAFGRNLDIRNTVSCRASKKHTICHAFFAIVDYLLGFHCENQTCHAFYTSFSVLKLCVNLSSIQNKKPEASIDKTVKDGPTLQSVWRF